MMGLSETEVRHCRDRAFYAYGTSRLFERRAELLARKRKLITFLGLAVPASVGSVVLSFGVVPAALPYVVAIAGAVSAVQLVMSVWSLVARWDERYAHSVKAAQAATRLYNGWDRLRRLRPPDLTDQIAELDAEDQRQEQEDIAQHVTDKEKRFAMRATLFYMKLPCQSCKKQPASMTPENCDTCGNC